MDSPYIAILFPGVGYTTHKPLLYYSAKLMQSYGYKPCYLSYESMPKYVGSDKELMREAVMAGYADIEKTLEGLNLSEYERVIFIGKSIGTIIAAKYAGEHNIDAVQIWYTPLIDTFAYADVADRERTVAFIGDKDQWSDVDRIKSIAKEKGIKLYSYPGCNHSLESDDVFNNMNILKDVMTCTDEFVKGIEW